MGLILIFFPIQIVSIILGEKWLAVASLLPILGILEP